MPTTITTLNVNETYASLQILTQQELNDAMTSIENYCNTQLRLNLIQLALDLMGDTYVFNDDGIQTLVTPILTAYASLSDNETVSGNWTFTGTVSLTNRVSSTSTFTSTGQFKCKSYISAVNQSITDAVVTPLSFGAELYDTGSMHSTTVNPDRFTVPAAGDGVYILNAQVTFAASAVGRRELAIYKNGSKIAETKLFNNDAAQQTTLNLFVQDVAVATDYYEFKVYQNSGGGLDAVFGEKVSYATALKVW